MNSEKFTGCAVPEIDTLTEQCGRVNELLGKAIAISHNIIGVPVSDKDESPEMEPVCSIDKLCDGLNTAYTRAQVLLNQLDSIANKI